MSAVEGSAALSIGERRWLAEENLDVRKLCIADIKAG